MQEKWDHMTRRWRENISVVQMTRLFLIDEVRTSTNCKTFVIFAKFIDNVAIEVAFKYNCCNYRRTHLFRIK